MNDNNKAAYRVVKMYGDRSGFSTVYGDTEDFREACIAREAAQSSSGDPHFIVAVPGVDAVADENYDATLKELRMEHVDA